MRSVFLTEAEAKQAFIKHVNNMNIDDIGRALSQIHPFEDHVVVVHSSKGVDSYAYWNGYSSDKRGDAACFTDRDADELRASLEGEDD